MTAQDVKATYDRLIFPPEGVPSVAQGVLQHGRVGRGARRHHHRGQPEVPVRRLPAGARDAVQLGLQQEGPGRARPWLAREQRERHRSVQVRPAPARRVRGRGAKRQLPPRGAAVPRRVQGDHRQEDVGTHPGHPRQPGRHRVPGLPAEGARRPRERARRQDHGAGEQLELRPVLHPEPRPRALRRSAGAPRAEPCGGPLGRLEVPLADRHREDGGRGRVPRPSAGRESGGARVAGRLQPRPRGLAGRSDERCSRKRGRPT